MNAAMDECRITSFGLGKCCHYYDVRMIATLEDVASPLMVHELLDELEVLLKLKMNEYIALLLLVAAGSQPQP